MNNQNPNNDVTEQVKVILGSIVNKVQTVGQQAIEKVQDPNFQQNVKSKIQSAYEITKDVNQKENSLNL